MTCVKGAVVVVAVGVCVCVCVCVRSLGSSRGPAHRAGPTVLGLSVAFLEVAAGPPPTTQGPWVAVPGVARLLRASTL